MTTPDPRLRHLCLSLGLLLLASHAAAQGPGVNREQMWPAPSAEDWKRPCLITWQRTWDDAVEVSKETGRPILVCVNMDGEIASEHYAGVRYRQPEIAALYEPYVTVIASVYRHTPRDYDEEGHRILCPRFGSVTCGEHIAIEPIIYAKFLDGKRIAPRHIMVELDGQETYDVYYTWDTDSVFDAVRDGFAKRSPELLKTVRGDRSIVERVASRDIRDRVAVETAYQEGDRALRRALLEAAAACGEDAPVEVLRQAVYGFDTELGKVARQALAHAGSAGAIDLISETLGVPMEAAEKEALIEALARMGKDSPRARRLSVVHRGLSSGSETVDVSGWSEALGGGAQYPAPADDATIASRLDKQAEVFGSKDAEAHVALAEAFLTRALERADDPRTQSMFTKALFTDARDVAREAEKLGAKGWRVNAVLAVAALYLGEASEAHARAQTAVEGMPEQPEGRNAMLVLALFAEARHDQIVEAVKQKKSWPGDWLTDMHAAHTLLLRHPLGDDVQVVNHYDFLKWLGADAQAARFLDAGLARFTDSWLLHDRLRRRTLREKGAHGLEAVYDALMKRMATIPEEEGAPRNLEWFAGYATLLVAEFDRRAGDDTRALAAYGRAIAHFQRSIEANAEVVETANHYVALAIAGQARLALEAEADERAVSLVVKSFELAPDSAATLDGLNISAVDTAKMLLARLKEVKKEQLAAQVEAALAKLDPKLLELPAYERGGTAAPPRQRGGQRPRQGRGGRRDPQAMLRFDRNGDGKIEKAEIPERFRDRLLSRFDKNKDGVIDAEEMKAGPTR